MRSSMRSGMRNTVRKPRPDGERQGREGREKGKKRQILRAARLSRHQTALLVNIL